MTRLRSFILSLLLILPVFAQLSNAQRYNFRHFSPPALPDPVVYTVNQDNSGFLWVGTGNGLYRFDGFTFRKIDFPDTESIRFATVIFKDSNGIMWVGGSDGTVHFFNGSTLQPVNGIEGQRINDIEEDPNGNICAVTQNNGIYVISGKEGEIERHIKTSAGLLLYSLCIEENGNMLAGTNENLLWIPAESDSLDMASVIGGIEYTRVSGIVKGKEKGVYYAGTEDYGIYVVFQNEGSYAAEPVSDRDEMMYMRVQSLNTDMEGNLWVATFGSGVIKFYFDETGRSIINQRNYDELTGLAGNDARSVFNDVEGNIWIALYGQGLNQLVSEAFTFYQPGTASDDNNILYIGNRADEIILGTPSGYHVFDLFEGVSRHFEPTQKSTAGVPASSYLAGSDGTLYIGTAGAGLFSKIGNLPVRQFYKSANSGENFVSAITVRGDHLWLSTRNGITVIDRVTGNLVKRFSTLSKLPHNNINQVFIDRDGNALVATEAVNIYTADLDKGITSGNIEIAGTVRNIIQGFSQSVDGSYWIATLGNGVFYFRGDSVSTLNTNDGMMSNYCYSILSDSESRLWIGHERGFSRYDPRTKSMALFSTLFAGGGDCNPNAVYESPEGQVFIGTTGGVIVYDRSKDLKGVVPPNNNIISITVNDSVYSPHSQISLKYNRYVVKIEYVGINHSNPDLVKYRTRLDNYDTDWTDNGTGRQVTYRLTDGTFRFALESVNEAGTVSASESLLEIIVRKPIWRRWWFILSAIALLSGIVVAIIRIREENQRRLRLSLENELRERTKEVVRQKEEIEQQNVEITDSINYARRIQSSILPDVTKLKESFSDAFIIFMPRDIVSGDFYWFERLDNDRFILACADSTGHGVPGAFMSMIGSTLLQDIITRQNITRPSEILAMLDKQIFSTLNRNLDVGVSNDGMDMVICEFNLKDRHIRFASAMRPVILIMEGEPIYVKGNRSSVGGMAYSEKFFDDQEYYLSEGDAIYLFSDGFPDQFGGEDGKKMKVARLKKLIESLTQMPMEEQKEYITNFFFDWKGDHEQVDDILFMGIKF